MRIISGYLKGKRIAQPSNKFTRPLKDLTKESIFNILQHSNLINFSLEKSKILDLFSGIGSFGLECLSRGAENVVFCENYPEAVKILRKNIINFDCEQKTQIVTENIFNIKNLNRFYKKKFELIFLDPPYREKKLTNLLDNILSLKLLKVMALLLFIDIKRKKKFILKNLKF